MGVEAYVLRFWETQFSCIRPKQSRSRHRYYTQHDVKTLKLVRHLLHTEGYTIAGARKFIRERGLDGLTEPLTQPFRRISDSGKKSGRPAAVAASPRDALLAVKNNGVHRALRQIREDLRAICKLLETH